MKKLFAAGILSLSLLVLPASVFAKPEGTPKTASREARVCEVRKDRIKAFFEQMVKRLEALIKRLEKLIDRIDSRIAKIESSGGTVSPATKAQVALAKTELADAKTKLNLLKGNIDTLLTCDNPKAAFKTVKGRLGEIKKELKDVHRILVHIIGDIKGLRVGENKPSPTPTP